MSAAKKAELSHSTAHTKPLSLGEKKECKQYDKKKRCHHLQWLQDIGVELSEEGGGNTPGKSQGEYDEKVVGEKAQGLSHSSVRMRWR